MNPMKPETAVPRMDELMTQFKNVLKALQTETVSHKLAELEREGILVVQELTLVAPRLHEVVMQASRNQRTAIARGLVEKRHSEALAEIAKQTERISEQVSEIADVIGEENIGGESVPVRKLTTKNVTKKKATKKAKK